LRLAAASGKALRDIPQPEQFQQLHVFAFDVADRF
jgi:hypothetical protein